MCGTSKGPFYNAKLEGSNMRVCEKCKSYAKEAWLIKEAADSKMSSKQEAKMLATAEKQSQERGEIIQIIVPNYGERIKNAREKLGLKQEVLAKQLAEKESVLHTWESGRRTPSIDMARKLEKALHITLVVEHEEKKPSLSTKSSGPLTIADLLKK
jgi:putative transcription factor